MTEQEKPFTSGEAFYEAHQNIKHAEQFANAGVLDKAYLTAYIAEKWIGLANSLQPREQSARWNTPAVPVPVADDQPKHEHGVECVHDWDMPEASPEEWSSLIRPRCRNQCGTIYSPTTNKSTCWMRCSRP